jgi:LPXTG-motif cell wall-anchored protein
MRILLVAAIAIGGSLVVASPASAEGEIPITGHCVPAGWYVNPDEGALLPDTAPEGILLYGPSLTHHLIDPPLTLATLEPGTFDAELVNGSTVLPLFKVETLNPYSTLNYVGDGSTDLWWSSRIAAGPGSQSQPIAAADLLGKATTHPDVYDEETIVFSFGVGYANDAGNDAVLKSITFMDTTYDFVCEPQSTSTSEMPQTGSRAPMNLAVIGAAAVIGGAIVVLLARRRRSHTGG